MQNHWCVKCKRRNFFSNPLRIAEAFTAYLYQLKHLVIASLPCLKRKFLLLRFIYDVVSCPRKLVKFIQTAEIAALLRSRCIFRENFHEGVQVYNRLTDVEVSFSVNKLFAIFMGVCLATSGLQKINTEMIKKL